MPKLALKETKGKTVCTLNTKTVPLLKTAIRNLCEVSEYQRDADSEVEGNHAEAVSACYLGMLAHGH
jgi:hypothetical protein